MKIMNGFSPLLIIMFVAVNSQDIVRKQCSQKSDVVFVLDSSGSISRRNFKRELQFVKQVASTFKMGPKQSQIAVISYSNEARVDIPFGSYSNVNDFNAALNRVKHQRQYTRIDKALDVANTRVFTRAGGARTGVAKVMVVLTDGKQTVTSDSKTLDDAVRPLQEKNVTVFAVGVGKAVDIQELLLLVGDNEDNVFLAEDFSQLARDSLRLAAQTCQRINLPVVHGNWSEWTKWGACSQSCGSGVQGRQRSCTNPRPRNGGRSCIGQTSEIKRCSLTGCPVNGSWSEWDDWGSCSVTCGGGNRTRLRTCTNPPPANGGLDCKGPSEETGNCNANPCPVDGSWSEWRSWSVCTRSCGEGTQTRSRTCSNPRPAHGGRRCLGSPAEKRSCNTNGCPVNGNWGSWRRWTECTKTCGGGTQSITRSCNNPPPSNGGKDCRGESERTRTCNTQYCPIDGGWGPWVEWSVCSSSCGLGTQTRFRYCDNPRPAYGGRACTGPRLDRRNCNRGSCPVNGQWGAWEEWGSCTESCNGGVQMRIRKCNDPSPANGGRDCRGPKEQTQRCNILACPVDGQWNRWNNWSACSRTCGIGQKIRSRTCTNPPPANGGKDCVGSKDETRECSNRICPVDGEWSTWKDWEPCSKTCGTGTQQRVRTCSEPRPSFGGKDCIGVHREIRSCQEMNCPVDGNWTEWRAWGPCSRTCGTGTQQRMRTCAKPAPAFGGKNCSGDSRETRSCQTRLCPVDGQWSKWKPWTECTRSCGGGIQTRARACNNPSPAYGGKDCVGRADEARPCNSDLCPVDGQWSEWKPWTECTRSCGGGIQTRARTCTNPRPAHGGKECIGRQEEAKPCNSDYCPVDGKWSEWRDWGECSRSCGGGFHTRSRTCTEPPPRHGGKDCSGKPDETRPCNTQSCPVDGQWSSWNKWTTCSKTCGKGEQMRTRNCTNPAPRHGGKQCTGHAQQKQDCNDISCAECSQIADIAFLVDASESMTKKNFEKQKEVIKKIAASFDVGPTKSHLGIVTFSSNAQVRVRFGDNLDLRSFQDTVDKLPFADGGTRFDKAFKVAANNLFTPSGGVRVDLPKVLIILTDGKQSADYDAVPVERSVLQLRHLGVRLFVLAVGNQIDMNELQQIVSDPKDIYAVKDFNTLLENAKIASKQTCDIIKRPELLCFGKADIAFFMDASESMTKEDFEKQKSFVIKVAESFYMAPHMTQFSLVTYSSNANLHFRFRDQLNLDSFKTRIKKLPFAAGGTRFDKVLKLAAEDVFTARSGARVGVPKVMVILTDGQQSNDNDAVPIQDTMVPLQQLSVQVQVVAIGSQVNHVELRKFVGNEQDILSVQDFNSLFNYSRQAAVKTCNITSRPPPVMKCSERADLAFIVDTSGSITDENFKKQKDFVKAIASSFDPSITHHQLGLISYSTNARMEVSFKDNTKLEEFEKAVDSMLHIKGRTRLDNALKLATSQLFNPNEEINAGQRKSVIILTDGRQSQDPGVVPLQDAVRPLRQLGVRIYVVAVSSELDLEELYQLTEKKDDVFTASYFDDLAKMANDVARETCRLAAPIKVTKCSKQADLAFVVDTSGSISNENFRKQKDFVKALASAFDPSATKHQLGLISYSTNAQIEFSFKDSADLVKFKNVVDRMTHTKGRTRLDKALKLASSQLFTDNGEVNSGKQKTMVILTDGRQSQDPGSVRLKNAVRPLKQQGVRIYVVAVSSELDLKELYELTEKEEDVLTVIDFDDLAKMANDTAQKICHVSSSLQVQCKEERINLGFVMGMSSSITVKNYEKQRNFVKNVADTFSISLGKTETGVITYNEEASLWIRFGQHKNNEEFKTAVDKIPYWGGQTRIERGLKMAADGLFGAIKQERANLSKILIVLTNGDQSLDPKVTSLDQAVLPLLQLGVRLLAVGIGSDVSRDELRLIVEKDEDIFTVDNFDELLAKSNQIARAACVDAPPSTLSFQGAAGRQKSCFKDADIGFVIDSSDSATVQEYQQQKELIQQLSSYYDISREDTRVGVIVYSDNAYTVVGLNSYRDSSIFQRAVRALPRIGGDNRKDKALIAARRMFKAKRPPGHAGSEKPSQVLVFITEGAQSTAANTLPLEHFVHPLRKHGVRVVLVGIGWKVVYQELRNIAQRPSDIYLTSSLADADKVSRDLIEIICRQV